MSFDLGNYEDVAARRRRFFEAFPEGSIEVGEPQYVERPDGSAVIRVRAMVYRSQADDCPGVDWSEEPLPGTTPYTKGSEAENASTSAIGRAILCVIPPLEGQSGASLQEVQARRTEPQDEHPLAPRVREVMTERSRLPGKDKAAMAEWADGRKLTWSALQGDEKWLELVEAWLDERKATTDA